MKTAVIATGGKQYLVTEGKKIDVELIDGAAVGETLTFDNVLLLDDGSQIKLGTPVLTGTKVQAKVLEIGKGDKVHVLRYKAKSNYRKTKNHRQPFVTVQVTSIK